MINIKRTFVALSVMALALIAGSCEKDETLYYNNLTMGNIVEGKFISDQGNTLNVVEQTCTGQLMSLKRAIILCDVLKQTAGAEKEYDIRLNEFASVLTKDVISLADADAGEETTISNPINIEKLWYSGGFLNMGLTNLMHKDSTTKHLVNLVYHIDEQGRYVFELRHNAYGDVWTTENSTLMVINGSYVSFPISELIEGDSAKLILKWKWYEPVVYGYDYSKTKEMSFEYEWKRTGFEQTPKTLSLKSSSELL